MIRKVFCFIITFGFFAQYNAQRNTILIIADDLSPDYFGFFDKHGDTVSVPNIRKLVEKGVRFTNAMSNPVCSSTRTTLLTGRYSFRTGVGGIVGGTGGSNQIDTAEISIPKLLKTYNSQISKADIGKWHLKLPAPISNLQSPQQLGYDYFEGPFIGQLPSYTNWTKYTNGVSSNITTYATTENVNNAVTWLKSINQTKPFFLWLAFNAPHEPLHLPPSGLHNYTSLSGTSGNINAQPKEYYKAMIQAMDHEIGRLFDSLQRIDKLDSTDIIFMGDNGNTPRTAQILDTSKAKGTIYQYGVNVPMIIAGPSVVNKGRVSNALVNTVDLFATILENFGYTNWVSQIPASKPVDAKSILPILKNTSDSIRPWVFCELFKLTTDSADGKGIRNKEYKLIQFDYGAQEFYNLTIDSEENNNLLKRTLTPTEYTNYSYLCHELNTLIGTTNYCKYGADINCSDGLTTGTATANMAVSGLSFTIPFSNAAVGTNFPTQSIVSNGVTGLTANLATGTYNTSAGNWTFSVTGIPSGSGTATFYILNGTTSCTYTINVLSPTVSIQTIEDYSGFSIYPHPAKDRLYIKTNREIELYNISIKDALGRTRLLLLKSDIIKGIDISMLSKGVYILSLIDKKDSSTFTKKLIVE